MPTDPGLERLVAAFEACTLPRPQWTHAAHLRVAAFYLARNPFEQALARVRSGIQRYNAAHGSDGYHETITVAFVRLVADRRGRHQGVGLEALVRRIEVELGDSACLLRHYSRERLLSADAKAHWVEPDLASLPAIRSACETG